MSPTCKLGHLYKLQFTCTKKLCAVYSTVLHARCLQLESARPAISNWHKVQAQRSACPDADGLSLDVDRTRSHAVKPRGAPELAERRRALPKAPCGDGEILGPTGVREDSVCQSEAFLHLLAGSGVLTALQAGPNGWRSEDTPVHGQTSEAPETERGVDGQHVDLSEAARPTSPAVDGGALLALLEVGR